MNILYYENPYLKECETEVIKSYEEEGKYYLRLNDNIFYAKGGGQKADKGTVTYEGNITNVLNCLKDEDGYPVLVTDTLIPENTKVKCTLDFHFRFTQMRLHTALHLLHCFVEEYYGHPVDYPLSSNIEADFAYNKYPEGIINDEVIEYVIKAFEAHINDDDKVTTYEDKDNPLYRYWSCLNYTIPCGGIHVASLKELEKVNISYHTKKGVTTVKITL